MDAQTWRDGLAEVTAAGADLRREYRKRKIRRRLRQQERRRQRLLRQMDAGDWARGFQILRPGAADTHRPQCDCPACYAAAIGARWTH